MGLRLINTLLCGFLVILCTKLCTGCKAPGDQNTPSKDWWETAQFYQIYPRSFMDSNGDGIGDINGITSKLQHLKDIGVTATWLSPIFKSPMADFGYDISDFYDIQDEYGTIADLEKLVVEAKKMGIKVILDFVPNHTSDEHEWFKKSVKREKGYEDFFIWHDGYPDPSNVNNRLPPSNWLSVFRGSAWEWNTERKQFYLHQFVVKQPDLNYRNPGVVQAMKNVLKFWLEKGISGFRIDAVPNLFEVAPDASGRYPDEPKSGQSTDDPDNSAYLNHIYTYQQPETIDMTYQWRKVLDDFQSVNGGDSPVLLIETYAEVSYTMQFYGNKTTRGAHLPFNFNFITQLDATSNALKISDVISSWMNYLPNGRTANWVIGNHDQRRAGSRYGTNRIDFMNMLIMLLPGVSVTYNGEEIGMIDGYLTWEQTVDPAACNSNPQIYEKFSRDPARTPFQWNSSPNAGFTISSKPWLPVADSYTERNVDVESKSAKSHLKVYKSLVALRSSKTLKFGNYKYGPMGDNIFVLERSLANEETLLLVANLNSIAQTINLSTFDATLPKSLTVKVSSVSSSYAIGHTFDATKLSLQPNEAIVVGSRSS